MVSGILLPSEDWPRDGQKESMTMVKRTNYVHKKMAHGWLRTFGFDNQPNAVAFRQRHRIGASTGCLTTPSHLVQIIGESRSGPQTISAKNPVSLNHHILIVSPIYIHMRHALLLQMLNDAYATCSANMWFMLFTRF